MVWQRRNYFEHIVRTEGELQRIRDCLRENPAKWDADPENPQGKAGTSANEKTEN